MKKYIAYLLVLLSSCQPAMAQIVDFKKVGSDDYVGGQNSNDYGDKIAPNQGTYIANAVIKNKGQIYTRQGQALFNKDTQTSAFNGVSRFDPSSALSYMM